MQVVTQNDIAHRLKLSRAAVAVALADSSKPSSIRVGAETRQRIQDTAQQMGYVPHQAARTLKSGKTNTIVLATEASLKYAYVHGLFEQIELALTPHGYHLDLELLAHSKDTAAVYRTYTAGRCDGVIGSVRERHRDDIHRLHHQGMPVVTLDVNPSMELDNVSSDYVEETVIGTRHLLDQGCRHIAYVVHSQADIAQGVRRQGYARALKTAGLAVNESSLIPWRADDDPAALWRKLAALPPRPDGVLVYNAELAARLSRVMQAAGVRVPDEVALVSLGDAEFHEFLNVPMTAVAADHRAMAAAVVERLLAQINDPQTPAKHILVKPHLVVRASSRK